MSASSGEPEGGNVPPLLPRSSRRIGYLVATAVLVLILVGGSVFLALRSKGNAATTAPGSLTSTPTPMPTETFTVTPPPRSQFYDTFVDNSHGWSLTTQGGFVRTLANQALTLTDTNPNTTLVESLPSNTSYDDFVLIVDFKIVTANEDDSAGIYVRGDSNLDHDYRIDINGNNTFDIAKEYLATNNNPQSVLLDGPGSSPMLNPVGRQNTLMVIMKDTRLDLLINSTLVSSVTDSDYKTGQIALFAHNSSNPRGVSVSFSRVEVDHLPEQTPGGVS